MDIATAGLLVSSIYLVVNFLKFLTNKEWNAVITNLAGVGGGWLVITVAAHAEVLGGLTVPIAGLEDTPVDMFNWADTLIVSVALAGGASVTNGLLGAIDSNRDTSKPALLPGKSSEETS